MVMELWRLNTFITQGNKSRNRNFLQLTLMKLTFSSSKFVSYLKTTDVQFDINVDTLSTNIFVTSLCPYKGTVANDKRLKLSRQWGDFNKNNANVVYIRYKCNLMRHQNNRKKTLFDSRKGNIHEVM